MNNIDEKILFASSYSFIGILEELLKFHESEKCIDSFGNTPLIIASQLGNTAVVKLLLSRSTKPKEYVGIRNKGGISAVDWAISKNYVDILEILLLNGYDYVESPYNIKRYKNKEAYKLFVKFFIFDLLKSKVPIQIANDLVNYL